MDGFQLPTPMPAGAALRPGPAGSARDKALATARDYEAVFIANAFKSMLAGVPSDPVSGETSSDNWRELLVDEYAKDMVRRGGIGLAAPIADELMKIQEASGL